MPPKQCLKSKAGRAAGNEAEVDRIARTDMAGDGTGSGGNHIGHGRWIGQNRVLRVGLPEMVGKSSAWIEVI
ncbi:MAG TPA: hypothetical protein DDY91_02815 [Planctomycetaceae bacterium]|nr:hypothetical protein [Planctomycetaceae bacterium]